jgi:hypothetical protein
MPVKQDDIKDAERKQSIPGQPVAGCLQ